MGASGFARLKLIKDGISIANQRLTIIAVQSGKGDAETHGQLHRLDLVKLERGGHNALQPPGKIPELFAIVPDTE